MKKEHFAYFRKRFNIFIGIIILLNIVLLVFFIRENLIFSKIVNKKQLNLIQINSILSNVSSFKTNFILVDSSQLEDGYLILSDDIKASVDVIINSVVDYEQNFTRGKYSDQYIVITNSIKSSLNEFKSQKRITATQVSIILDSVESNLSKLKNIYLEDLQKYKKKVNATNLVLLFFILIVSGATIFIFIRLVIDLEEKLTLPYSDFINGLSEVEAKNFAYRFNIQGEEDFKLLGEKLNNVFHSTAGTLKFLKEQVNELDFFLHQLNISTEKNIKEINHIIASFHDINSKIDANYRDAENISERTSRIKERFLYFRTDLEKIQDMQKNILSGFDKLKDSARTSLDTNLNLGDNVNQLFEKIQALNNYFARINNILQEIIDISEQSNLLSLNASIEAVKAGKYGKGFVVVATEMAELSEKSLKQSSEIMKLIEQLATNMSQTPASFKTVSDNISLEKDYTQQYISQMEEIANLVRPSMEITNGIFKFYRESLEIIRYSDEQMKKVIERIKAIKNEIEININYFSQSKFSIEDLKANSGRILKLAKNIKSRIDSYKI